MEKNQILARIKDTVVNHLKKGDVYEILITNDKGLKYGIKGKVV